MTTTQNRILAVCVLLGFGLIPGAGQADPLFPNSIVSTDIDFITADDPDAFGCLEFTGRDRKEMPDKLSDALFQDDVFVFKARFDDGTDIGIWAAADFGTVGKAQAQARKITHPLGTLPPLLRAGFSHVVLHRGDETAFSEAEGHFVVLYSDNVDRRIETRDIQETVFHEAVHAVLDAKLADSREWRAAQRNDRGFITEYAARHPDREDLAEAALFAYTYFLTPERLPETVRLALPRIMPHRLKVLRSVFIDDAPRTAKSPRACNE